jgi:hypothetical protein
MWKRCNIRVRFAFRTATLLVCAVVNHYMPVVTESCVVKKVGALLGWGGASLALALTPVLAASTQQKARKARAPVSLSSGIGSFTPAVTDPRLAAVFAGRGFQANSFRFTPASAAGGKSKAIRVAVRARSTTPAAAVRSGETAPTALASITPAAYNLGVAVGWKSFAVSGDVLRVEKAAIPGKIEAAQVGIGYSGKKVGGRLQVAAERVEGQQRLVGPDESYSVDVGASYSIARNIDLTGGVRYKIQRERLEPLQDDRRDSQAVYIGTAFRF